MEANKKMCVVCGKLVQGKRKVCSPECCKEQQRRHTFASKSDSKRATRARYKKLKYSSDDKEKIIAELLVKQNGLCEVCGSIGTLRGDGTFGLVLDHDHRTGKPRALLCGKCNVAFGMMGESPDRIVALLRYASRWSQASILDINTGT
jgi:hypothetical protein